MVAKVTAKKMSEEANELSALDSISPVVELGGAFEEVVLLIEEVVLLIEEVVLLIEEMVPLILAESPQYPFSGLSFFVPEVVAIV